jgi:hypothetical protein
MTTKKKTKLYTNGHSALRQLDEALDHHVGGLDESSRGVAFLQLKLAHSICGDDCRHVRVPDSKHDLGEKALDADADYLARKLISAADAPIAFARLRLRLFAVLGQKGPQRGRESGRSSACRSVSIA